MKRASIIYGISIVVAQDSTRFRKWSTKSNMKIGYRFSLDPLRFSPSSFFPSRRSTIKCKHFSRSLLRWVVYFVNNTFDFKFSLYLKGVPLQSSRISTFTLCFDTTLYTHNNSLYLTGVFGTLFKQSLSQCIFGKCRSLQR